MTTDDYGLIVIVADDAETVERVTRDYIYCALWATTAYADVADDGTITHDPESDASFERLNFGPDDVVTMPDDIESFVTEHAADIDAWHAAGFSAGHDLFLTRNHHGVGFWDRDYSGGALTDIGQRLTNAAHALGESEPYLGDDGSIHF